MSRLIANIIIPDGLTGWDAYQSIAQSNIPHHRGGPDRGDITHHRSGVEPGITGEWVILDDGALPPIPYEDGDNRLSMPSLYNPDTLSLHVDQDTGDTEDPDAVAITIVQDGQGTDIIVSRRRLLTALGVEL